MPSLLAEELRFLSPDAFKSWTRCKKQFYYKYEKHLQWPSDGRHFKLGRDVHKLLDYQARGLDCSHLLAEADDNVRVSWEKLQAHPVVQWTTLASEWGFHVPVAGAKTPVWLVGRMDRVAGHDGIVWVIDWKTGTGVPKNPAEDWQTRVYLYALLEIARAPVPNNALHRPDLKAEQVRFVYVEVKTTDAPIRLVEVPYDEARHEATRARLAELADAMAAETEYALPDACPDRFCPYRTICGIEEAL